MLVARGERLLEETDCLRQRALRLRGKAPRDEKLRRARVGALQRTIEDLGRALHVAPAHQHLRKKPGRFGVAFGERRQELPRLGEIGRGEEERTARAVLRDGIAADPVHHSLRLVPVGATLSVPDLQLGRAEHEERLGVVVVGCRRQQLRRGAKRLARRGERSFGELRLRRGDHREGGRARFHFGNGDEPVLPEEAVGRAAGAHPHRHAAADHGDEEHQREVAAGVPLRARARRAPFVDAFLVGRLGWLA